MARVQDLLVFKAMAGRPHDVDDAVTLLTLYPNIDLNQVRRRVTELAELAEAPELSAGLDRILHAAAATARVAGGGSGRGKVAKRPAKKKSSKPPARKR